MARVNRESVSAGIRFAPEVGGRGLRRPIVGICLPDGYDGATARIDTTTYTIEQLAYAQGVSPGQVLSDLMQYETAYYWAAWEDTPSGKSRFEIRLDPAELGRIDVRIDVDRNGQVTSHLTVEKPETLSMLRQDATQLQRALNDAGLSTGGGGLQFSLRDQSQSGQNDQNQSNPNVQRLIVAEEEVVPAAVAGRSYGRMFGPSGGVDIRV